MVYKDPAALKCGLKLLLPSLNKEIMIIIIMMMIIIIMIIIITIIAIWLLHIITTSPS